MDILSELPIADIKLYSTFDQAETGLFLQTTDRDGNGLIGVRFNSATSGGTFRLLLALSESRAGEILMPNHLPHPAIDITPFVDLVAVDPSPQLPGRENLHERGRLFQWGTAEDAPRFIVAGAPPEENRLSGVVCIYGGDGNISAWSFRDNLPHGSRFYISKTVGVRLKREFVYPT